MPTNPEVIKKLEGATDLEYKRLIISTYRYNSVLGLGLAEAVVYEKETGDGIAKNISVENGDFTEELAVDVFTKLFPDFDKRCLEYLNQIPEDQRTVREALHRFAIYLAENISSIADEDKDALFHLIELMLDQGKSSLKYLIGSSFLEDFQNSLGNLGVDPEQYEPYLKTETKKWWDEVNGFWSRAEKYYTDRSNVIGLT